MPLLCNLLCVFEICEQGLMRFDWGVLIYRMHTPVAFIHFLPEGNLECSQIFPSPTPLSMCPDTLHAPACLQKMYPAEGLPGHRGDGRFFIFKVFCSKQGIWSGTVLVSILPLIATSRMTLGQWLNLSVPVSSPVRGR